MPSYLSIASNISFNNQCLELEETTNFVEVGCLRADTSILSIVLIFMEHPYTPKLACDVPFLLGSNFEVHWSINMA